VVENRPAPAAYRSGGGDQSPPDGYTLRSSPTNNSDLDLAFTRSCRMTSARDTTPVASIMQLTKCCSCRREAGEDRSVVHRLLQGHPGKNLYASSGNGTGCNCRRMCSRRDQVLHGPCGPISFGDSAVPAIISRKYS